MEDGKILIVEAKGGSSGLGSRVIRNSDDLRLQGKVAEQGSRAYLEEIINVMKEKGGKYLELAEEIEDALDKTNVVYIMVKQELNLVTGELKPIIVEEFNIDN